MLLLHCSLQASIVLSLSMSPPLPLFRIISPHCRQAIRGNGKTRIRIYCQQGGMGRYFKNLKMNLVDATSLQLLPLQRRGTHHNAAYSVQNHMLFLRASEPNVVATCFLLRRPQTSPVHNSKIDIWQRLFQGQRLSLTASLHHHMAMATVFDLRMFVERTHGNPSRPCDTAL